MSSTGNNWRTFSSPCVGLVLYRGCLWNVVQSVRFNGGCEIFTVRCLRRSNVETFHIHSSRLHQEMMRRERTCQSRIRNIRLVWGANHKLLLRRFGTKIHFEAKCHFYMNKIYILLRFYTNKIFLLISVLAISKNLLLRMPWLHLKSFMEYCTVLV